jgi:beta-glucosidase
MELPFMKKIRTFTFVFLLLSATASPILDANGSSASGEIRITPWTNTSLKPDERAKLLLAAMTPQEKLQLVFGYFSTDYPKKNFKHPDAGFADSAGYIPGITRLGIPPQWETDAGIGVATQRTDKPRERTALPSGLATVATWDPEVAFAGGAMIGNEARLSGFNIQLAGGVNLMREPRNGRNFEYGGEDPLLAGTMVGEEVKGIQSNHILSTVKHFAFNGQETNRFTIDSQISDQAAHMSDLLAFQIALEVGDPGAVMCAYNRVNGSYACESDWLLNQVLKKEWGFKGYVMSDWGATHSTIPAANSGLDQESGYPFDLSPYFTDGLAEAVFNGHVTESRMNEMAFRILRQMIAKGLIDDPVNGDQSAKIDYSAHGKVSQADEEEAIVLLKNDREGLPLKATDKKIAIIGGHADVGVLSGGGSSQVYPIGGLAVPNEGPADFPGPMVYFPSSPLKALASRASAKIIYNDGKDKVSAAKLAAESDVAIVFATQWTGESLDVPSLQLPNNQDALIAEVARSNKNVIVVLETGGPVLMPWLNDVSSVLEAWYPGSRGGEAIARVLTGEVNPSGHLPITFPVSEAQLPRPKMDGDPQQEGVKFATNYNIEGAAVGYKWFDLKQEKPLFAFGHGLSYTSFEYSNLRLDQNGHDVVLSLNVKNIGDREGKAVAQIYVSKSGAKNKNHWEAPKRLGGWAKVNLKAGETTAVKINVDPRLLSVFNSSTKKWQFTPGDYRFFVPVEGKAPVSIQKRIAHVVLR